MENCAQRRTQNEWKDDITLNSRFEEMVSFFVFCFNTNGLSSKLLYAYIKLFDCFQPYKKWVYDCSLN